MSDDRNEISPGALMLCVFVAGTLFTGGSIAFLGWLRGYYPDAGWQWLALGTLFAAGWACLVGLLAWATLRVSSRKSGNRKPHRR